MHSFASTLILKIPVLPTIESFVASLSLTQTCLPLVPPWPEQRGFPQCPGRYRKSCVCCDGWRAPSLWIPTLGWNRAAGRCLGQFIVTAGAKFPSGESLSQEILNLPVDPLLPGPQRGLNPRYATSWPEAKGPATEDQSNLPSPVLRRI